jgi:predicted DNA binding protein
MLKARITASHNCWASRIGKLFPEEIMSLNNTIWLEDSHALDVFTIRSDNNSNFDKIINFLKSEKTILRIKILERQNNFLAIQVDTQCPQPIARQVYKNYCFQLAPTILNEKGETWTLGSENRENIKKLFETIERMGTAKIEFLAPSSYDNINLTEKQRTAFNFAMFAGYYETPRKINIQQLAKAYGIGKTTFSEHLRKTELKILHNYLNTK